MGAQVFELAILLSLKDAASGKLDHVRDKLRATGKEGKATLQSFEELRKGLSRDLTIGGIGVAGLMLFNRGVKASGDYQASLTDLRVSISELNRDGTLNLTQLGDQMNRFDRLGTKLGNSLPGSTQDFIQMFSVLKQKGLETEAILNGAGEAVGNLAVVSKEMPKELAVPFAEFGQQFKLKGEDFPKLADLFARARAATGATPGELVEASKYFQLRAGTSLGLTGFEGAEMTTRLLALLGRQGLKGSEAGTGLSALFSRLTFSTNEQQEVVKDLKSKHGIDLQFFDKKGKFAGIENAVAQLEKLRVLDQKTRGLTVKKLFEQEGAAAANLLIDEGTAGLARSNEELQRRLSLQQQVTEQTKGYNAKREALSGTLENLKVTAFEPMLGPLTAVADKANLIVGAVQQFASANPMLAATATGLMGIGSAALVVYSGVRTLQTGWRMWKIVSAVGSHEADLLAFLRRTKVETAAAGDAMQTAGGKAAGLKNNLSALSALKGIGLAIGVTFTIDKISELLAAIDDYETASKGWDRSAKASLDSLLKLREHSAQAGVAVDPKIYESNAANILRSLNREGNLKESLEGGFGLGLKQLFYPFVDPMGVDPYPFAANRGIGAKGDELKRRAPELIVPDVMREFMKKLDSLQLSPEARGDFNKVLQSAFPESYKQATQDLGKELAQLSPQVNDAAKKFEQLNPSVIKLPPALNNASEAAQHFADNVNNLQLAVPQAMPGAATSAPTGNPPSLFNLPPMAKPSSQSPVLKSSLLPDRGSVGNAPNMARNAAVMPKVQIPLLQPYLVPDRRRIVVEPSVARSPAARPPVQPPLLIPYPVPDRSRVGNVPNMARNAAVMPKVQIPLLQPYLVPERGRVVAEPSVARNTAARPPVQPTLLIPYPVPDRSRVRLDPNITRAAVSYAPTRRDEPAGRAEARGNVSHVRKNVTYNVYATPSMNEAALVDRLKRMKARDEERA